MKLERYASAQDAARAAAEAAQIIRRNEAQNVTERERHAHALAEVARLTSLEPVWAHDPPNNAAAENKAWVESMAQGISPIVAAAASVATVRDEAYDPPDPIRYDG